MRIFRFGLLPAAMVLFFSAGVKAQSSYKGKVINQQTGKPVSYASIKILKKNFGLLSDASGNFSVSFKQINNLDTFQISSIGYEPLNLPANILFKHKELFLTEKAQDMENVVLKSYSNEATEGSISEKAGYFRCWTSQKNGGEIGKHMTLKHGDFKVEKIRFKINNQYDTCLVRVRIRSYRDGFPRHELMSDSIAIFVGKQSYDDKYAEFDFSNRNLIIKDSMVFISLEILHRGSKNKTGSLCFIGTEPGNYMYKSSANSEWEESASHSIYLKMYYKY